MTEPDQIVLVTDDIRLGRFRFERLRRWYSRYERYLIPGALLFGVTTDALLFQNINLNLAFAILTWHLLLSGLSIMFIQTYDAGRFDTGWSGWRYVRLFVPLVLQYTFGALLSGFLIFYWFSSSFAASWPFIVLIIFLMVSNDLLKKYYLWPNIQIGVYFFIIFSYAVLILPFLLRQIAVWVFLLSGLFSLAMVGSYLYLLARWVPIIYDRRRLLAGIIAVIFVAINGMYFANIIPPVPLSLRQAGIYHLVNRVDDRYQLVTEKKPWWRQLMPRSVIHIEPGRPIYLFASVFSPTRLDLDIVHHWQHYDQLAGRWVSRAKISYPIVGGRDGGYRGWSFITNPTPGRWRVNVETRRGQIIGRETFRVVAVADRPDLIITWSD